jgi:ERCC4-type nuclease
MWVKDMAATITAIEHLDAWAQKVKHTSLTRRSGPAKSSWGSTTVRHLAQHIMQGFPGVGPELAGRIVDKFEGAPLTFSATYEELLEVEGLGKGKADAMMAALGWAAK